MHLTLGLPGLLLPEEILASTTYDLDAPTLSLIIGRGRRRELPDDWLANAFGLNDLPTAALRKIGTGGTVQGEWLCLDPVRWQVAPEGITLDDPDQLGLDETESAALLAALQPVFAEWGELSASAPNRWELHLKRPLALQTIPLPAAIHQAIDPSLPGGEDGPAWRRLLAEAQLVLHDQPANRQREAAGLSMVNSLWPWGPGSVPDRVQTRFTAVWSNDPALVGLCRLADIPCTAPPERFQQFDGQMLVITEVLTSPARTLDALGWREALLAFERDWLVPAVAALKRGECTGLRLIGTRFDPAPATVAYELKRSDLLRFWRKPHPLSELK